MALTKLLTRPVARVAASLTVTSFLLSACVTPGVTSAYGAGDPAQDVCYAEHQELAKSKDFFTEEIVKGVLVGAILGGLAGAAMGRGDGGAIAAGAAAGALMGGATGYFSARQKEAADRSALTASIYQDLVRENDEIDRVTVTFAKVRQCRIGAAAQIKADYKAGKLPKAEAERRLARLRDQYKADVMVADQISGNMAKRYESYQTASDQLLQMDPEARTTLAAYNQNQGQMPPMRAGDAKMLDKTTIVRDRPDGRSAVLARLNKGDMVEVLGKAQGDWEEVLLADGRTGYVAPGQTAGARPVDKPKPTTTAAKAVPAKPTGPSTVGVAQLTSSSQIKQSNFTQQVAQAKTETTTAFELSEPIGALPGQPTRHAALAACVIGV